MKGGYQIIDLSKVTVGTQATIDGIYSKIAGNNGKAIMIVTPDKEMVLGQAKKGTNKYIAAYVGADGTTYSVEISNADKVDITTNVTPTIKGISYMHMVDIKSYNTSSNLYTVPSDGLIFISVSSGEDSVAELKVKAADAEQYLTVAKVNNDSQTSMAVSVPAYKGEKYYIAKEGTISATFRPYVYN